MIRVLALSLYGYQAASHRVRLSQFQDGLSAFGIDLQIQSLLDNSYLQRSFAGGRPSLRALVTAYGMRLKALHQADHFDLLIVYGELFPFLPFWLERRLLNSPFVYDIDDAFYLKYRTGRLRWLRPLLGEKFERMMASAVAVTAGSSSLAAYSRRFNRSVTMLPSCVDTDHYLPVLQKSSDLGDSSFTIGWIGSPSTAPYLQQLVEPLQELSHERSVRLLVVGAPAPVIFGVEVIEKPWSLQQEVSLIHQFDVGVMPLPDSQWARGKCAYKLIQCMACAIPVIASPVGANVDVVPPNCGLLPSTSTEWLSAFRQLAANSDLRNRLGVAGRKWVEQHYSLSTVLPMLSAVIQRASAVDFKS